MPTPPTTLTVRLDRIDEPIAGCVGAENGSSLPFTGWLELAAALERSMHQPAIDHEPALREAP